MHPWERKLKQVVILIVIGSITSQVNISHSRSIRDPVAYIFDGHAMEDGAFVL